MHGDKPGPDTYLNKEEEEEEVEEEEEEEMELRSWILWSSVQYWIWQNKKRQLVIKLL